MKWLLNLRSKTYEEKRAFAFVGSIVITAFIFFVWLVGNLAIKNEDTKASAINPYNEIQTTFAPIFSPLVDSIKEIKNSFK